MADVLGMKISELAETTDLAGLYTIGSDKNNQSKKVSLQFVKEAADYANAQGDYAKTVGDTVQGNTGVDEYPVFSASQQYAAGDVVLYEGRLYKFTALHAAGAWVGTDVVETSIKDQTDSRLAKLSEEIEDIVMDVNNVSIDINGGYKTEVEAEVNATYVGVAIFKNLKVGEIYHWHSDIPSRLYFRDADSNPIGTLPSNKNVQDADFVMFDISKAAQCIAYADSKPFNFAIQRLVEGVDAKLEKLKDDISASQASSLLPLYLSSVVQKNIGEGSSSSLPLQLIDTNAASYVSTKDLLILPKQGLTLHITLPQGMKCEILGYQKYANGKIDALENRAIKAGTTSQSKLQDGDVATLHSKNIFYRVKFYFDGTSTPISAAEVQDAIDNGTITIMYESTDTDKGVVERNLHRESDLKGVMVRNSQTGNANITTSVNHGGFTFIHASDLHGDVTRWRSILQYAEKYSIDKILTTGDYCVDTMSDGEEYLSKIASQLPMGSHVIPAMGNHDMAKVRETGEALTEQEAFNNVLKPFVEMGNISADKTYYFQDVQFKQSIIGDIWNYRIIVLNTYDGADWTKAHIGQAQVNFLIDALKTIPVKTGTQAYGVIVMMHGLEYAANKTADALTQIATATNFYQTKRRNNITGLNGTPISKIIDAWQSRTTLTDTFTNNDDTEIVSINADFSQVDTNAEFICFISGHEHYDLVGYNPNTTNKQLVLNINSAAGHVIPDGYVTLASSGDLPRDGDSVCQDSFNVCAVDRQNGRLKIMRVGADLNVDLVRRDICSAPYK